MRRRRLCARGANPTLVPGRSTSPLAATMRRQLGHVLAMLVAVVPTHADSGSKLLDRLAQELKSMRSLPVGTPTHAACPAESGALVGLTQRQVEAQLGQPDFRANDGSWTYFFASPAPFGQDGGGFPELTFSFGAGKIVAHVSCHYSR